MQRPRPGIAKASLLPGQLGEGRRGSAIVRSVLSDLDALIEERDPTPAGTMFVWGSPLEGGARLKPSADSEDGESLRISWTNCKITGVEVETRKEMSFRGPESPADPLELMDWLVPRLWAYIQRGGALPSGIERFAGFF